jgi:hypothetical protein
MTIATEAFDSPIRLSPMKKCALILRSHLSQSEITGEFGPAQHCAATIDNVANE